MLIAKSEPERVEGEKEDGQPCGEGRRVEAGDALVEHAQEPLRSTIPGTTQRYQSKYRPMPPIVKLAIVPPEMAYTMDLGVSSLSEIIQMIAPNMKRPGGSTQKLNEIGLRQDWRGLGI